MTWKSRLAVLTGAMLLGISSVATGEDSFVGAKKCRACHLKQFSTWEQTNMAQSFDLLKPGVRTAEKEAAGLDPTANYTADPKCLPCHTTGYGQPGGFTDVASTPDLVGVQCESCHGPGGAYLAKDKMSLQNKEYKRADLVAAGLVIPDGDTCTSTCHNANSPFAKPGETFDFEQRKRDGTHEHIPLKFPH